MVGASYPPLHPRPPPTLPTVAACSRGLWPSRPPQQQPQGCCPCESVDIVWIYRNGPPAHLHHSPRAVAPAKVWMRGCQATNTNSIHTHPHFWSHWYHGKHRTVPTVHNRKSWKKEHLPVPPRYCPRAARCGGREATGLPSGVHGCGYWTAHGGMLGQLSKPHTPLTSSPAPPLRSPPRSSPPTSCPDPATLFPPYPLS